MRLPRKVLTKAEAIEKKQKLLMSVQNLQEEIIYWHVRLGKPLEPIDTFLIMADKTVNSPESIIVRNTKRIDESMFLINNYCHQFCHPSEGRL